MGFDANEVMQELDASRAMQELDTSRAMQELDARRYPLLRQYRKTTLGPNSFLQQYQKTTRGVSVIDRLQRSIQGSMSPSIIGSLSPAAMNRSGVYARLTKDYSRMHSNVLNRMLGGLGLSSSIAQVFEAQGLASANIAAWNLRRVQSVRTPALQSILKATTTFGPIVISPDDEDAPFDFDYHPNLQRWLLPETATESGDAIDIEKLWAEMVASVMGIARLHRTKAVVRGVGKRGVAFLVVVAGEVVGQAIWYWLTHP